MVIIDALSPDMPLVLSMDDELVVDAVLTYLSSLRRLGCSFQENRDRINLVIFDDCLNTICRLVDQGKMLASEDHLDLVIVIII